MTKRNGIRLSARIAAVLLVFLYSIPAQAQSSDRDICLEEKGWNIFKSINWESKVQSCTAYLEEMNYIRGDSFLAIRSRAIAYSHLENVSRANGDMVRVINQLDKRVVQAVQSYLRESGYYTEEKNYATDGEFSLKTQAAIWECAKAPDCVVEYFSLWNTEK